MPNIRSQQIDDNGIQIVGSDGRIFSMNRAEIRAHFLTETGAVLQRLAKTRLWLRQRIVATLGSEQIDIAETIADFRESDGGPTQLEFGGFSWRS
jgi:hypothetical protein